MPNDNSLPAMDRPSVYFAHLLDSIVVEVGPEPADVNLVCENCAGQICSIEDADTMRVLLNTALAHTCT